MKSVFTCCLLLLTLLCQAQKPQARNQSDTIRFDATGQLTTAPNYLRGTGTIHKPAKHWLLNGIRTSLNDDVAPSLDETSLRAQADKQQQTLRTNLKEALTKAYQRLQTDSYYQQLWGNDRDELAKDLNLLIKQLNKPSYGSGARLTSSSALNALDSLLINRLDTSYLKQLFSFKPASTQYAYTATLLEGNLANDLLLTYYNCVRQARGNELFLALTSTDLRRVALEASYLLARQDSLFKHFYEQPATVEQLNEFSDSYSLLQTKQNNLVLFKLLKAPWLKSWLWHYTGRPLLNPLPFTEDSLVRLPARSDSLYQRKTRYFNSYLRKSLADLDTVSLTTYLTTVRMLGRDSLLLADTAAYRKSIVANRVISRQLRTVRAIINEISVPLAQPQTRYATAYINQKNSLAATAQLSAISTDTYMAFTAHNLVAKHELKLVRTRAVAIVDQSELQQAIAASFDGLSPLKTQAAATLLNTFNPQHGSGSNQNVSIGGEQTSLIDYPVNTSHEISDRHLKSLRRLRLRQSLSFDWGNAEIITKQYFEQHLGSTAHDDDYRFARLLPDTIRKFDNLLFKRVKTDLAAEIKVAFAAGQPEADLLKRVRDYYLAAYLDQTARSALARRLCDDTSYLRTSLNIVQQSTVPPQALEPVTEKEARYHSEHAVTTLSDSTRVYTYSMRDVAGNKTIPFAAFGYRTGKRYPFQVSAGLAYNFQPVHNPSLSTANGQITYTSTDVRYRVLGAVHIYPGRLFLQDNRFFGRFANRANMLVGVGIPSPLDNFYFGAGYDLGPGLKVSAGLHLHIYPTYEVQNNQVINEGKGHESRPFVALSIDPASFIKALTFFF